MTSDLAQLDRSIVLSPVRAAPPPSVEAPAAMVTAMARDQELATSADRAIKLLARAIGRQAARRHLARECPMIEVALVLVVAALALAAALYLQAQHGRLP